MSCTSQSINTLYCYNTRSEAIITDDKRITEDEINVSHILQPSAAEVHGTMAE